MYIVGTSAESGPDARVVSVQGALDGGLNVPHSEKRFVGYNSDAKELDAETLHKFIYGGHVADYMNEMQVGMPAVSRQREASGSAGGLELFSHLALTSSREPARLFGSYSLALPLEANACLGPARLSDSAGWLGWTGGGPGEVPDALCQVRRCRRGRRRPGGLVQVGAGPSPCGSSCSSLAQCFHLEVHVPERSAE